ncbi:MAG: Acg family FMN-binding oxidoreductase [Betaproteobacteria bacterium]
MAQDNEPSAVWTVPEAEYPERGSPEQQLKFLLRYAILAPSSHNSQPWRFRIRDCSVELLADYDRALPVADPLDRELIISCGAALFNLRTALNHFGCVASTHPCPEHHRPDLLARINLDLARIHEGGWPELFRAIPARITDRGQFAPESVPPALQDALCEAAHVEGVWLRIFSTDAEKEKVGALIAEADRLQFDDPAFRRELASWLHSSREKDGLPAYSRGAQELMGLGSAATAFLVRTFDLGNGVAARDRQLATGSPLLACLGTTRDTTLDWLSAGQALQRVLLTAAHHGYSASFLNQPVEVAALRPALATVTGHDGFPQIVLRIGRGSATRHTPRRSVDEVLVSDPRLRANLESAG